jgi:hypothetical protein
LAFLKPIFCSHGAITKVRANSFTYCLGRYWQRYAARKSRLEGVLEKALSDTGDTGSTLYQLAVDITDAMQACADAFEAEMDLREGGRGE